VRYLDTEAETALELAGAMGAEAEEETALAAQALTVSLAGVCCACAAAVCARPGNRTSRQSNCLMAGAFGEIGKVQV